MNDCKKPYTDRDKWIVAIISAILFLIISSPFMYSLINDFSSSFGLILSDGRGCPLISGLIINSLIFMLVIRLLMR